MPYSYSYMHAMGSITSGTAWDVRLYAMAVPLGSLLPSPHENMRFCLCHSRRACTGTWSHQQCVLVPASSDTGRGLPWWDRLALCKRGSLLRRIHHWIFPWGWETGQRGAEGAAKETKTSEGIKHDTGEYVSAIVPVWGASLKVVQTKVIDSKCSYEGEKCKTTK